MSETLFDYQTRLRDEEVLYLLRAIAEKLGIAPFAGVSEPVAPTPPLRVVEVEACEPAEAKNQVTIQYAKFDPLCRAFADDRTSFGKIVEKDPFDTWAQLKLDQAKSRGMHRNRAIGKMIKAGKVRYSSWTFEAEFDLNGTWVPWRPEFCPQTEIKKRSSRKSK
jgi:hypothetical protein